MAWVILLVLLLLPTQGWGAIALTSSTSVLDNDTSSTVSVTCPAGDVLVVSAGADNRRVTSATYNSVTLTELYDDTADGGGALTGIAALMAVTGCDGAAHDLVTTWATTGSGPHHVIVSWWSGVETASVAAAHRTVYTGGDAAGFSITVVDSQSGDVVVHGAFNWGTNMTAGNTSIVTANGLFSGAYDHLLQYANASGASTAMSITGGQYATGFAFALVPASGGGGPDVTPFYKRRAQ